MDYYDKNRGVVYLYEKGSDGNFTQIDRLYTPEGTQVRAHLTDMIFLDDFLLVGAPGKNKVYVFQRGESGYDIMTELTPSGDLGPESSFGISLDGKGTDVIVGDYGEQSSHLFSFEDGAWKQKATFDGFNTALSGDSIMQHTPVTFETNGDGQYGGDVNFYDLVCEQ